MLVDTGSAVTLISYEIFNKFSCSKPQLLDTDAKLQTASGEIMKVHGKVQLELYVGGEYVSHSVIVATLGNLDGILGLDFIENQEWILDLSRGTAVKSDRIINLHREYSSGVAQVQVADKRIIPPNSEACIAGLIDNPKLRMDPLGLVEPVSNFTDKTGLIMAASLVNTEISDRVVPVKVMNTSQENITLHKGMTIATLQPLAYTSQVRATTEVGSKSSSLPDHLAPLCDSVSPKVTTEHRAKLLVLLQQFADIFLAPGGTLGRTNKVKHSINTGDAPPIKLRPRRVPISQKEVIEKEITEMLDKGIIEPSDSPWSAPVVIAVKKDGSPRFCVDYRQLNKVTRKDAYPLPRIDDSLESLTGMEWFCTLDLASGYFQVAMEEADKPKTAFTTHKGLFQFNAMPFGVTNGPATFERLMELILRGLQWERCLVYLDDVIVFGKTFEDTLCNLRLVFERLRDANLTLKPKKCFLFQESVKFLGHIVSAKGIHCDPDKLRSVTDWPRPENITDVRSFLGTASYYRRFIPDFSTIAAPLTDLTRKDVKFRWSEAADIAFNSLKTLLISAPILSFPREKGLYILDCDASGTGIGSVLSQIQDGEERVIAYASQTLSKTQRRYCTTYRELLAVVVFVKHFRFYLGRKFLIRTDHHSLRWLTNFKDAEGMLARWLSTLSSYNFDIEHRSGKLHGNADGLSRQPASRHCKRDNCPQCYPDPTVDYDYRYIDDEKIDCHGNKNNGADACSVRSVPQVSCCANTEKEYQGNNVPDRGGACSVRPARETSTLDSPACNCKSLNGNLKKFCHHSKMTNEDDACSVRSTLESHNLGGGKWAENLMRVETPVDDDCAEQLLTRLHQSEIHDQNVAQANRPDIPREFKVLSDRHIICPVIQTQTGESLENWIRGWDLQELKEWQNNDVSIKEILDLPMKGSEKPAWSKLAESNQEVKTLWSYWQDLIVLDGLLYKKYTPDSTTQLCHYQLVAPRVLRHKIMEHLHNHRTAGHLGVTKTLATVKQRFYWPGMTSDISRWCNSCSSCAQRKPGKGPGRSQLKQLPVGACLERVALDIVGPLPTTDNGNEYILVIGDYYTKWTEAYALPNHTAQTVADKIVTEFFSRFGLPFQLHSDQGPEFMSALFKELSKLLEIEKTFTACYRPQSDGFIERFNRTVQQMLSMFVSEHRNDWDDHLPYVMMAYRATIQESTGCSPNLLMLGREITLPIDLMVGSPEQNNPECPILYVEWVRNVLQDSFAFVREQLRKSAQRQKRNYDKHANPRKYPIGSWVWRWYPPKAKQKLGKGWTGPYLVINQLSDITYRIQETAVSAPKVVHIDHLKPFYTDPGDLPDIWIDISLPRENPVNLNESVPNADTQNQRN